MYKRDRFDDMMVDIGSLAFDLTIQLNTFMFEILQVFDGLIENIELPIPFQEEDELIIITINGVYFNEDESIELSSSENKKILWDDLGISSRELLTSYIHLIYTSNQNYSDYSGN